MIVVDGDDGRRGRAHAPALAMIYAPGRGADFIMIGALLMFRVSSARFTRRLRIIGGFARNYAT